MQKRYEIKEVRYKASVSKDVVRMHGATQARFNEIFQTYEKDFVQQFALGTQPKVEHKTKTECFGEEVIPFSSLDYIKHFITSWQPSLCFGWLKPQYRRIFKTHNYAISNTYYNVIPVDFSNRKYKEINIFTPYREFREIEYMVNTPNFVSQWLDSPPPTIEQVDEAIEDVKSAKAIALQKLGMYKYI